MSAPKKIYLSKLVMAGAEILDKPVSDDDVEYIRADIIRAEIERLEGIGGNLPLDNREQKTGYESALIDIETFLDTPESEKPVPNDFEEARTIFSQKAFEQYDHEQFINACEEPVSDDLEEAAKDFVWEVMENDEDGISDLCRKLRPTSKISDFYDALAEFFIAGAKWQKQHDAELIEIAYNDGITIGMSKQKEQMMKEAVEGEVYLYRSYNRDAIAIIVDIPKENLGDKVRIIIVKEGEK